MENKINIAEILKDCSKGMELDCILFEDVVLFDGLENDNTYPITIRTKDGEPFYLTKEGYAYSTTIKSKCVIFPKGKTTWEGFQRPFKDGDVVTYKYEHGLVVMILSKFVNFVEVHHYCALYDNAKGFVTNNYIVGDFKYMCHATEEEKQKLFDAIKANGYKWNAETKTLEKLVVPIFKVGDRIKKKGGIESGKVIYMDDEKYDVAVDSQIGLYLYVKIKDQDNWKLNKFDITTLKPFESRVLMRTAMDSFWKPAIFGFYDEEYINFYAVGGNVWKQCIPYEGNEHLLGTTNNCDEFYKNW